MRHAINIAFDFRSDTPVGKDPDVASPTLRRYHKLLWSKPLPGGVPFELSDSRTDCYLYHRSELGEFFLASDTVIPSFRKVPHIKALIPQKEIEAFNTIGYTIGGMMVFPGNKIDGKMTMNGARGFHPLIRDRFDLTLECIRRHYAGEASPLSEPLRRYSDFFMLFADFRGYVEFFLLQDLVIGNEVKISGPYDNFRSSPVPKDAYEYRAYRDDAVAFINARNQRIQSATTAA
ncbi:hypothetical protein EYB53_010190 [Candidatus Chloroploca sp. M-50]|uniref:Uncharacterized protein n=1 Tax=Candidatus Chloroploca mongolica TaxID=2528176 RepID=A0ABS4D9F8_9CHLR|nr:hypothetical protein [Candidatus Chloroploca mongolica]MBP1466072.1 hypothetical protein [Candidatus Chloroploca mongolica]